MPRVASTSGYIVASNNPTSRISISALVLIVDSFSRGTDNSARFLLSWVYPKEEKKPDRVHPTSTPLNGLNGGLTYMKLAILPRLPSQTLF